MRSCRARQRGGCERRATDGTDHDRGQLGLGEFRVGDDELCHGRHQEHELGPELVDHLEPPARVEFRLVHAEEPELHGVVDESDAGEGEQRAGVQPALPRVARVGGPGDERHVAVTDGDTLGQARGARRVEDVGEVLAGNLDLEGGVVGARDGPRPRGGAGLVEGRGHDHLVDRGERAGDPVRERRKLGVGEHHSNLGVAEEPFELPIGQPGVGGHSHCAGLVHRRVPHHEAQGFFGPKIDRHPVALGDTHGDEGSGQQVGLGLPLGERHVAAVGDPVSDLVGEGRRHGP